MPRRVPPPLIGRLSEVALRSQRALERNPRNPEALVTMCLVALASRQTGAAVRMGEAAVSAEPGMGAGWIALGQALRADGQNERAEEAYAAALRLDGMNPLARLGLGELRVATGRPGEALREFELALKREPESTGACLGMGHALSCLRRYEEALEWYDQARRTHPRLAEAEFAAGFSLQRLGRGREAERRYRRALALRPDFAAAWMNLGCVLREEGRDVYAETALRKAVELRPDLIAGWVNLALLERERGRDEEAESHLRHAFELNPDHPETHVAWAQFCAGRQDAAGAWGWLRWALARDAQNDEAWNGVGILLHNDGRFEEAVSVFARAEELGSLPAASNRGNSLLDLGRMDEALRAHALAVERDPKHPGARYNLALTELRVGEWERGWVDYEARWSFREVHRRPRKFDRPRWHGEQLEGQRVLLHAEQGLGDTIQFCRYATLVAQRGGVPLLQVQAPVERLMHSLAVVRDGCAEVAVLGETMPDAEFECPLMSLAGVFGTTPETVPWWGAYLAAGADKGAAKRARPASENGALRVGIAWAGNPKYKADRSRSMRLATLVPLLRVAGVMWVSLQKGDAAGQIEELEVDVRVVDASSGDSDLAETAATIDALDLVITTDTSIAHLAGAMGKPVWILLPHLADWRWMQETQATPWYPSARLIRQNEPGDWDGVLNRAIRLLEAFRRDAFG